MTSRLVVSRFLAKTGSNSKTWGAGHEISDDYDGGLVPGWM